MAGFDLKLNVWQRFIIRALAIEGGGKRLARLLRAFHSKVFKILSKNSKVSLWNDRVANTGVHDYTLRFVNVEVVLLITLFEHGVAHGYGPILTIPLDGTPVYVLLSRAIFGIQSEVVAAKHDFTGLLSLLAEVDGENGAELVLIAELIDARNLRQESD